MGKYDLLTEYLLAIPADIEKITLTLKEIEKILNFKLPESSKNKKFWVNDRTFSKPQSIAWMYGGWIIDEVDLDLGIIFFSRDENLINDLL